MNEPVADTSNIPNQEPISPHNINRFLENRPISNSQLAKLCNITVGEIERIRLPKYDPYISELITIHQGIIRVTDCTLEELLNPEAVILPDKQQVYDLERLREIGNELLRSYYPDLNGSTLEQAVERDSKADAFKRFAIQLIKHSTEMLDSFGAHEPITTPYTDKPKGYFKYNNIYDNAEEKGNKYLRTLKEKYDLIPAALKNSVTEGDKLKIAKIIFDPYQDFRLSQLKIIQNKYFTTGTDSGASISDLIHSPDQREKDVPESSKTHFNSSVIILGQVSQGLINSYTGSARGVKAKLEHIKILMGLIESDWEKFAYGNDFSRRGPRASEESIRHLRPIKEADLKDAYFSS